MEGQKKLIRASGSHLPLTTEKTMAPYDSDSSEDEFTETNVLLGYASKDSGDDSITRLGGQPVRLQTKLH